MSESRSLHWNSDAFRTFDYLWFPIWKPILLHFLICDMMYWFRPRLCKLLHSLMIVVCSLTNYSNFIVVLCLSDPVYTWAMDAPVVPDLASISRTLQDACTSKSPWLGNMQPSTNRRWAFVHIDETCFYGPPPQAPPWSWARQYSALPARRLQLLFFVVYFPSFPPMFFWKVQNSQSSITRDYLYIHYIYSIYIYIYI